MSAKDERERERGGKRKAYGMEDEKRNYLWRRTEGCVYSDHVRGKTNFQY